MKTNKTQQDVKRKQKAMLFSSLKHFLDDNNEPSQNVPICLLTIIILLS